MGAYSTRGKGAGPDPEFSGEGQGERGLWRWVCFSGVLHSAIICGFFFLPAAAFRPAVSYPVYSVELVGGEKVGGASLSVGKEASKPTKKPRKVRKKPPRQEAPVKVAKKKTEKKKKTKKVKKAKKARKRKPLPPVAALKKEKKGREKTKVEKAPLKTAKKTEEKEEEGEDDLPDRVRERLIQSALDRVKKRAETAKGKEDETEQPTSGPNEEDGAAAPGEGGRGGGVVKGVEFLIYRNRMLYEIKERWTWVGKRTDLEVTVRFGIREDGEIVGLRLVDSSGDPSYDESVMRAVKRVNPLQPPPANYRGDFMDVQLTFRPIDLSR